MSFRLKYSHTYRNEVIWNSIKLEISFLLHPFSFFSLSLGNSLLERSQFWLFLFCASIFILKWFFCYFLFIILLKIKANRNREISCCAVSFSSQCSIINEIWLIGRIFLFFCVGKKKFDMNALWLENVVWYWFLFDFSYS